MAKGYQYWLCKVCKHIGVCTHGVARASLDKVNQSPENVCPLQEYLDRIVKQKLVLKLLSGIENVFEIAEFELYADVKQDLFILIAQHDIGDFANFLQLALFMHSFQIILLRFCSRLLLQDGLASGDLKFFFVECALELIDS